MAYQTAFLFKLPHSFSFYSFVFLGTVCSYNFHWALTPELFQNPILQKRRWNGQTGSFIFFSGSGPVLAMYFFMRLRQHWTWLAGAMVLAFLYSAPKIPWPPCSA
jgi:hypothetical protein